MRAALAVPLVLVAFAAAAQTPPTTRPTPKVELDQMLTALGEATSEAMAGRLEAGIDALWARSGGPTAALLLGRGSRDLAAGDAAEAVADADAALALAPDMAEAYSRRALARYHGGDVIGAIRDLQEAIRREPRHFGAWRSLAGIAEAQGNAAGALAAWKQLLAIDPKTPGGAVRLKELAKKVEGEES